MQRKCSSFAIVLALAGTMASISAAAAQDAAKGKAVFEQCAACHSLEAGKNEVGPTLHGLFGRKSASEEFLYSPAMKRANVTWTPELLETFLANPQGGAFRGNRMPFAGIPDAQARTDLIAYLKQATQ
jgi:cytochrome c